ncbi:MAG TPA: MFS transporter [Mycobacteriales bacterium]
MAVRIRANVEGAPGAAPRRARIAVSYVFAAHGLLFGSWAPRIPEVKSSLGLSPGLLGIALLAPAAGSLLTMPLAGAAASRVGSARATQVVFVAYCLLPWVVGLAGNLGTLWLALFGWGAALGSLDVVMNAQGVTVEKAYRRPVLSSFHAAWSIGALIGTGAGSLLAGAGVPLAVQLAVGGGVLLVVGLPLTRAFLPDPDGGGERPPAFARPTGRLLALGAAAFACLVCEGAAADWSAVQLRESLGATVTVAGAGYIAFTAAMTVGRLLGDRTVARFGRATTVRALGLLGTVGMAGGLLSGTIAGWVAGMAVLGLGLSAMVPTLFGAAGAGSGHAGPAIAAVSTCGYLGMLLGPSIIGGLAQGVGLTGALWIVPALTATAALLGRAADVPAGDKAVSGR